MKLFQAKRVYTEIAKLDKPSFQINLGHDTTYLEIVNPPSDKLIEFHHFITVANAPATARELFHSLLKFRY